MKITTLCYIEKDEKCLLLHRTKKKNDENAGKWIGVGGKCEEGESPEDCLVREVREETGLTLTAYRAQDFTGELTECSEGELVWVPLEKRASLPTWEGDRIFLRLLEEERPFFSLKLVYAGEKLTAAVLDGKPLAL